MRITKFGYEMIKQASADVTPENICYEVTSNRGGCIDQLKCEYLGNVDYCYSDRVSNEAYCAIVLWTWGMRAIRALGYSDELWMKNKTMGALDMLNRARKTGIEITTDPQPGDGFYRKSGAAGSSGHTGLVVAVEPEKKIFHTIEGNNVFYYLGKRYEGVWGWNYPYGYIAKKGFKFMKYQNIFDNKLISYNMQTNEAGLTVAGDSHQFNMASMGTYAGIALLAGAGITKYMGKW